jgi:hypothetical protein
MKGQSLPPMHYNVVVHREVDEVFAQQVQAARVTHSLHTRLSGLGIHEIRGLASQTEHDRFDAAVPVPGGAQRTEEFGTHARNLGKQPVGLQGPNEHASSAHRPDGVRTGRADPDLEQVENADGHR